jgi:NAD(P)-dependent dehydrogenase (short-subunit alcohol dehydrogenase family)
MRLLVEQLRRDGWSDGSSEAEMLRERLRGVSRQRAVWRTRERLVRAGSPCFYEQADATKEGELARALEAIRAAHGPIHGVVHGAGCIEDARIGAKSLESFRRVLHAKAHSTRHLRALLERDPMQFAFLFSSLAAHTGTAGQTDYVAANEIVGAVAEEWNRGVSYPVRALLWGVWSESGLASRALKRQMTRLGIEGISNHVGVSGFLQELQFGDKSEDWVLLTPRAMLELALNPQAAAAAMGLKESHASI